MKRNYGIDALRVVCMFFVVVLHLVGIGGLLKSTPAFSGRYYLAHFLQTATYCAVNCYALISGFIGWNRKPKLRGLLVLWLKAVCWCAGVTALRALFQPEQIGLSQWMNGLMPISKEQYWYLSAYAVLFLFQPLLNSAITNLSKGELFRPLAGMLLLSLAPVAKFANLLRLGGGYTGWWLCILYLLGGFLGKHETAKKLPGWGWLLGYLVAVLVAYVPRMAAFRLLPSLEAERYGTLYLQYTSPTMILAAVCLVLGFSRWEPKPWMQRAVSRVAPYAFGVYLFHVQPFLFQVLVSGRMASLGNAPLWKLLGGLLAAALGLYTIGTIADWVLTKVLGLLLPRNR